MNYTNLINLDAALPVLLYIAFIGLIWGSFMGMLVKRTGAHITQLMEGGSPEKNGVSIYGGRSVCMSCNKQLAWHNNIPILSWLSLKGKSSCCDQKISSIYPITEFFFMLSFPLAFYFLSGLPAIIFLVALSICYTASYVDLKTMHIPIEGNYLLLLISVLVASMYQPAMEEKIIYAIILWLSLHLINVISPQQLLGEGDIPILTSIVIISFGYLFNIALVVASIATMVIFVYNLIKHKNYSLARMVPFGPGLSISYMFALFVVLNEPLFN